jgi:hypothetical protein
VVDRHSAAAAPQAHQHGDALPIEFSEFAGQGLGIVARVENAKRHRPANRLVVHEFTDLGRGDGVGIATRRLSIIQGIPGDKFPQCPSINVAGGQGVIQTPRRRRCTGGRLTYANDGTRPTTVAASSNSNNASRRRSKQSYTPALNCRSVLTVTGSIMPKPTGKKPAAVPESPWPDPPGLNRKLSGGFLG